MARDGCVKLWSRRRSSANGLLPVDCESKIDWACQGTSNNKLNSAFHVKNDLMADEGAFCLWHIHEPVDVLPNDEGTNFRNTDLQCHLQTSSRQRRECAFNLNNRRRGLERKRGNRHNGLNYPVRGSTIGWEDSKAKMSILNLE